MVAIIHHMVLQSVILNGRESPSNRTYFLLLVLKAGMILPINDHFISFAEIEIHLLLYQGLEDLVLKFRVERVEPKYGDKIALNLVLLLLYHLHCCSAEFP